MDEIGLVDEVIIIKVIRKQLLRFIANDVLHFTMWIADLQSLSPSSCSLKQDHFNNGYPLWGVEKGYPNEC